VLVTAAFATGFGLLLGTLNVFARDIGQVMVVVLQLWFWLTPVVYPINIVPQRFVAAMAFNPMTALVEAYEAVLVYGTPPSLSLCYPAILAGVLLLLALHAFRKASPEMVDAL
jgi:lipopolysaccharide transport system permease protein